MRRLCHISLVTILWLFSAANATSAVGFKVLPLAAKAAAAKTDLSSAFSPFNTEIELTGIQLFTPVHHSIDKKEPFNSSQGNHFAGSKVNVNKAYFARLLAVTAANSYKLLFPFHHFW